MVAFFQQITKPEMLVKGVLRAHQQRETLGDDGWLTVQRAITTRVAALLSSAETNEDRDAVLVAVRAFGSLLREGYVDEVSQTVAELNGVPF